MGYQRFVKKPKTEGEKSDVSGVRRKGQPGFSSRRSSQEQGSDSFRPLSVKEGESFKATTSSQFGHRGEGGAFLPATSPRSHPRPKRSCPGGGV